MIFDILPNSSQDSFQNSFQNSFSIYSSFTDLSDTEMSATTGGITPFSSRNFVGSANKVFRWEGKLSASNPNLPLLAQRLINGYHKGTNRPEDVASLKLVFGGAYYWRTYAPRLFNLLPLTAGGTPDAISSVGSFLSSF